MSSELRKNRFDADYQSILLPRPIHFNPFIKQLIILARPLIDLRISIVLNLDQDLWEIQRGSTQINQVLLNLILNARDAMPHGRYLGLTTANVQIKSEKVAESKDSESKEYVLVNVTDAGHGIPKEIQAKIFEPFFTTKEVGKGTGLGLAMAYGILNAHGGWIEVQSCERKGTSFYLYFPRQCSNKVDLD